MNEIVVETQNQNQCDNLGVDTMTQQKDLEKRMWELLQKTAGKLPGSQLPYTTSLSLGVDIPGVSVYSVEDAVWVLYKRLNVLKESNELTKVAREKAEAVMANVKLFPKEFFNEVDPLPARFARIFFCAKSVLNLTSYQPRIRSRSVALAVIIELTAMINQLMFEEKKRYEILSSKGERVTFLCLDDVYLSVKKAGEELQQVLDEKLKHIEVIHEVMLDSPRAEPDALELLARVYSEQKKWNDPVTLGQDKSKLASSYGFIAHLTVVELKHAATMLMFTDNEAMDKLIVKTKNIINQLYEVESGGPKFDVEPGVEEYQDILPVLQKLRADVGKMRDKLSEPEFNKLIALLSRAIEYVTIILTIVEVKRKGDKE